MRISSSKNELLKTMRRLRRSKGSHALLEGPHLLEEALEAGRVLDSVLVTPEFQASELGGRLLHRLERPPVEVPPRLLDPLMDAEAPRGVLAVARVDRGGLASLPPSRPRRTLYLDGLQDPGNLGALARVAEAGSCDVLILAPGSVHPNHPRALRASAGCLLRLPVAIQVSPAELERHFAKLDSEFSDFSRTRWLALAPRGGTSLYASELEPVLTGSWVLLVGAEGPGLSVEAESRARVRITIPMAGTVESLNATVAAALLVFEARRLALKTSGA